MSRFFRDWKDAQRAAQTMAGQLKLNVEIRKTEEYGRSGFTVGLADTNSRFRAEIVEPQKGAI